MPHRDEALDFVVAVFLIERDVLDNKLKVLFVDHIKQNKWLPIGGHIDPGQDPDEALFTEVFEETGFTKDDIFVLCYRPEIPNCESKPLLTPAFVDRHTIFEGHDHVALVYFAVASSREIILSAREHRGYRWLGVDEFDRYGISASLQFYARKAIEVYEKYLHNS